MVEQLENNLFERLVAGYGLVDLPLEATVGTLTGWRKEGLHFEVVSTTDLIDQTLSYLSILTHPATRYVALEVDGRTALVNNGKNGSDITDIARHLAMRCGQRVARVVNQRARSWTNGTDKEVLAYEARLFELYGSDGGLIRGVTCANDGGRWVYEAFGQAHPIEETFVADAKLKNDRFTSQNLTRLIEAHGFRALDAETLGRAPKFVLLRQKFRGLENRKVQASSCTVVQADDPAHGYFERGLSWVPLMRTHAESVVADFERAVKLNPAYEPLVRSHLIAARRHLGRATS